VYPEEIFENIVAAAKLFTKSVNRLLVRQLDLANLT
jgi:hypothetical protein